MNLQKLKEQEERFLIRYPGGFKDPLMERVSKRHNISRFVKLVSEKLTKESFNDPEDIVETISKIIRGSSLVSVFEKTAFKNMIEIMNDFDKLEVSEAYKQLLHGNQALGFELLVNFYNKYKNAKWPIITAVLYYSNPDEEFVVKPTTAKQVIQYFELEDIKYVSRPTYEFYSKYRKLINDLKEHGGPALKVENGPFCGFLMFATGLYE